MNRLKYVLSARGEITRPQYEIDWDKIAQQVQEAKTLVETTKEPEMKKKTGRKKKGY